MESKKLICSMLNFSPLYTGQLFAGSLSPTGQTLSGWLDLATSSPRHPSLVAGKQSEVSINLKINNIFKKLIFMILPPLLKNFLLIRLLRP